MPEFVALSMLMARSSKSVSVQLSMTQWSTPSMTMPFFLEDVTVRPSILRYAAFLTEIKSKLLLVMRSVEAAVAFANG